MLRPLGRAWGASQRPKKRLATVEGLMRETAFQTGDAARYASTFAGAQAALKAQTKQLSSAWLNFRPGAAGGVAVPDRTG